MQHDGIRAGELMMSRARNSTDAQRAEFCRAMDELVRDTEGQSYFEHIGDYVSKVCTAARECMVKLDVG
jgi:hypothetical protein